MADPIDTNVVIRFLVEDPDTIPDAFRGVFPFFEAIERGDRTALLPPLVLFQSYFVLTSYYEVPGAKAAEALRDLLSFRGLRVPEKSVLRNCLGTLIERSVDLVDAYLAALCARKRLRGVHSLDQGLSALGIDVLPLS